MADNTVLVEIIRDSKNKYFFRDRELFKLLWSKFHDRELLRSRIIRHVRIRTYMCAQVQPRFVSRATTTLWSRRSRRKRLNRQSRLHCLPDKFRHLGRSRSGKTSKRPVGSPLCVHESREQCSLTRTRCPMT